MTTLELPSMKAVPTAFEGVTFRSRLESRWGALFTQFQWHWNYEPFDLHLWFPDFHLEGRVLVEVKPFTFKEQWSSMCREIIVAMDAANRTDEVLLLGTDIMPPPEGYNNPQLGWLLTRQSGEWELENAMLYEINGMFDFSAENGRRSRLGRAITDKFQHFAPRGETIASHWAEACNRTKWSPA